jgi:hypothetical protein
VSIGEKNFLTTILVAFRLETLKASWFAGLVSYCQDRRWLAFI